MGKLKVKFWNSYIGIEIVFKWFKSYKRVIYLFILKLRKYSSNLIFWDLKKCFSIDPWRDWNALIGWMIICVHFRVGEIEPGGSGYKIFDDINLISGA